MPRVLSPKSEKRIVPYVKRLGVVEQPSRLKKFIKGVGAGAMAGLGAANAVVNFVHDNPALSLIGSTLLTGGAIGVNHYLNRRIPVKTTKDEAVESIPKQYAEHFDYYGPDTRYAAPPNMTNTSKYDAMFPTPTPTPTPSISNPMNNTEINVVNHNSTKA